VLPRADIPSSTPTHSLLSLITLEVLLLGTYRFSMHGERENQELGIEGNIAAPPGRTISSDKELLAAISDFYARNPNVIGGGDILTVTGGKPVARAGMVAAILAGLAIEGGERAMLRIVIVLPPGDDVAEADGRAWESFGKSFEMLACRPLEADEAAWFRDYLVIQAATDGRHVSLLALMAEQPERTAIIVVEAAEYRDDAIAPFVADGAQTPLIPEDVWAPQVHALAVAVAPIARERHLYVALDVNEGSPIRPVLGDLILSVDGFGVIGSTAEESAETIVAKRVDAWDRWIALGQAGRALADVDALPPVIDPQKAFLRVQLLHKAGLRLEALALIRSEFLARGELDPSTRVRLGRIAEDAGAAQLAAELIAPCIDALESREDLESALGTLQHRDDGLAARIATRLEARFPNAEGIRRHRRQQLLRARDHAGLADFLRESDPSRAGFHARLAEAFAGTAVPDYVGLIQSGDTTEISDGYRLASIVDALARGLIWHAFNLVGDIPKGPAQAERWEGLALEVLERGFLQAGPEGEPAAGIEATEALLGKLIGRLAGDPMNARLRSGIVDLLKPDVAGTTGLALIAKYVLDLAGRPVAVDKGAKEGSANMEWMMAHKPFLHRALNWLQAEQPIIIGKLALPAELLTESPDEAISALSSYIERAPISDDSDIHSVQLYLALAAAMAPHAADPDIDLRLYRLAAGKIASSGFAQTGRDLVETAVQAGTATPRRRRLAWFAVADTYHRTRDHLTGLVALACAFAADNRADEEELWQEVYGLTRLLRDIGLLDAALTMVDKGRELLERMKLTKTYSHRLDLLALQVRLAQRDRDDPDELAALLAEATAIGRTVLDHQDQTAPTGIILGQLIRDARERGVDVPGESDEVFAELNKWAGGTLAAMIAATSAPVPTLAQLAGLAAAIPPARYAEDVGFDMGNIAFLAQRTLASDIILAAPEDVSFALELLADRGTALPNWDEAAAPPAVPQQDEPAAVARAISTDGVDVLQLGFDARGRLIRVAASGGALAKPVVEDSDKFSRAAFHVWSQAFPYRYGIDESPNLFYRTTEPLQLSWSAERPTILSASSELQSFPPNILYDGTEFLGRKAPAAAVPSLSWLSGARERNHKGDGRRVAWISTAEGDDGRSTLTLLAQRLDVPFTDHGFEVDHGGTLPERFAGASIAVLTAHGGVHPEGRYFQLVSDEGVLKVSAADLAAAVRNVGVVILFICSGGRTDKHPMANTTLGLAKQVLDRGCSAVIASPWPLDSQVPPHWLDAFLTRWEAGDRLMDAAFAANQAVDKRFALDPARGLAMTTYGDGLLTKP